MSKKVIVAAMIFFIFLGAAFFIREIALRSFSESFWQVYLGSFAAVYAVFTGAESVKKYGKSKYYRPEMDDKHPEVQKVALEKLKRKEDESVYE